MTGRHLTTTSPSSTSSRRSTPCVDGCWGPMLTLSSSRRSVAWTVAAPEASIGGIHPPRDGEVDGLRAKRLCASERVAAPIVGQHDALQVRMADERDPEEVEQLALVPVGARHDRGEAGRLAICARLEA